LHARTRYLIQGAILGPELVIVLTVTGRGWPKIAGKAAAAEVRRENGTIRRSNLIQDQQRDTPITSITISNIEISSRKYQEKYFLFR
jgi:hypothetical protein